MVICQQKSIFAQELGFNILRNNMLKFNTKQKKIDLRQHSQTNVNTTLYRMCLWKFWPIKFQEKNFVRNIELLKYVNTLQQTNHDENLIELFREWKWSSQ